MKKREIRARYLSHTPGLRTCHPVKISNFEAHADMNIVPLTNRKTRHIAASVITKGDAYTHIPGHLPLLHLLQGFQVFEVWSVAMKR